MKSLITFFVFLLILFFAEIANANALILPLPVGDGYRVIERTPQVAPPAKKYVLVKVLKSRDEIRRDIWERKTAIEYNRNIIECPIRIHGNRKRLCVSIINGEISNHTIQEKEPPKDEEKD